MGAGWVRSCNNPSVCIGEGIPGARGSDVSGAGRGCCRFDGRAVPTFDGVEHALLFLSLCSEARDLFTRNDRSMGVGIDDSWEYGATVASRLISISVVASIRGKADLHCRHNAPVRVHVHSN